ncbi:LysR family transcriptional regulator [Rhodoferax sp.]|uniref:LysR family transcriptional regulator n=1 Tax=Rhodoferax sp. TaxID=50421 RepID=UPI002629D453|nr:LysR family transcriptional regulator [Rhodoferax sp.]MDD5480018.1 LysR family transcriptional regulator [Rhodoferax sp.]
MQTASQVLTPDALQMLQTIARTGSFAAAARDLGMVPSALTYRVRQMEDALDVLLFDRSARQAKPTPAGRELLRESERLLQDLEAVANRVKRVATGWEPQFTIAIDSIIAKATVMELCDSFLASQPPTRIRLRDETLSGTLEALTSGQADLALGVADLVSTSTLQALPLGDVRFVYAVAPHHPLASAPEPLADDLVRQHRAVAVADTISRGNGVTIGLLGGQDVLTVATMQDKLDAQLRGLGCGSVPECMAGPYIDSGRLVVKTTQQPARSVRVNYAWRASNHGAGRALQWWLGQLQSATTRSALLERHRGV